MSAVVHEDPVRVHGEGCLHVLRVVREVLERRDVLVVAEAAPQEAHVGASLGHEHAPLLQDVGHAQPVHVVQQDVPAEEPVGVPRRHLVQLARAHVDAVHRELEGLVVLGLQVARAALARVAPVQVPKVVVVVGAQVRGVEQVVHGQLDDVAAEQVQLRGGHGDQGAPQALGEVEDRCHRVHAAAVLAVDGTLLLHGGASASLCTGWGVGAATFGRAVVKGGRNSDASSRSIAAQP